MTAETASARADVGVIDSQPAAALRGVTQRLGTTETLADVTLEIAAGEFVAIVGPSGCGKTTLLDLLCGVRTPSTGSVQAPPAALVPQRDALLPWATAAENAALALRLEGIGKREAVARARPVLDALGLGAFADARPHQLSGGMRQRVAIARALVTDRPLLCCDEPFAAVDTLTRRALGRWLQQTLTQAQRTVVFVTHDIEEAVLLADRIVVFSSRPGRIVGEFAIAEGHPRDPAAPECITARREILEAMA